MLTAYNVRILAFVVLSGLLIYAFRLLLRGLKKYRKTGQGTQLTLCIFGLLGLIPIALIDLYIWFLFLLVLPIYPHYSFGKTDWTSDVARRYTMADDLVDSQKLIGLTRSQAVELLGKPYREWDDIDHTIRYNTGERPTPGLDLDPDELVLNLKDGKVINCYLHET